MMIGGRRPSNLSTGKRLFRYSKAAFVSDGKTSFSAQKKIVSKSWVIS